jgi:hypothetical protein
MAPMRATTDIPAHLDGRQGAGESCVAEGEEEEQEEAMEGDGTGRRRAARKRAFKYGDDFITDAAAAGRERRGSVDFWPGQEGETEEDDSVDGGGWV